MRIDSSVVVVLVLVAFVLTVAACRTREASVGPASPQAALTALSQALAASDYARVFELLDEKSQWSVSSVHEDLGKICSLIRAHYPKQAQARELGRCVSAAKAATAAAYLGALASEQRLFGRLPPVTATTKQEPDRVALVGDGTRAEFCKEIAGKRQAGWYFCGLRGQLNALKVKTARDRESVAEYAEAYRSGR